MEARLVVLIGAGFVGLSAAATSAVSLYGLALNCGIPEYLAAALPIALDAGAAVGALAWITQKGAARQWGCMVAIAGLLATIAGNAVEHALTIGLLQQSLLLVLCVGAVIPAMLWAVVHLAAVMAGTPQPAAPKTRARRDASSTPAASATKVQLSKTPEPGKPVELGTKRLERDRSRRDVGREWARRNWPVTGTAIANELGVSRAEGDRIRQSIKNEVESAS